MKKILLLLIIILSFEINASQRFLVKTISGKVEIKTVDSDIWKSNNNYTIIESDFSIRTDDNGVADIIDNQKSVYSVDNNSSLTIKTISDKTKIIQNFDINFGIININKAKNNNVEFKIATPVAVCGVRGTVLSVQHKNQTSIGVFEGQVEVNNNRNKVILEKNKQVNINSGNSEITVEDLSQEMLNYYNENIKNFLNRYEFYKSIMLKNYNKEKQKMLDKYESQKTPKSGTKKLNMMEKYELQKNRMLTKYEIEKNIMIADWISQKADILKRWGDFKNSTKKEFVNYSDDLNSRSSVNYDEGYVEVETLVEENETKEQAIEKLKKHIEKIIKSEDASGKPIVKDQIDFDKKIEPVEKKVKPIKKVEDEVEDIKKLKVEKVDDKKIEKFVSENVTENNVKIEKVKSEDKKVKQKVTVKIPLKDKHTLIRAKKYYDLTKKYSKKYGLDPEYTLAVMETESYFNPYARSPIPAYGLMQLVPATGAYDASKLVFGEHKKLEGKLLYNPELNINLGAAYFDLIFNRYLKKYKHLKFKYLVACTAAYNCGPTRISRFMKKKNYSKYSDRDFYIEIKNNIPEETQNYIDKVLKRTNKYYKYNLDTLE